MSLRPNVLAANYLTANCPAANCPTANCLTANSPVTLRNLSFSFDFEFTINESIIYLIIY